METKTINLDKLNQMIREGLDHYYKYQDADSFFRLDQMLQVCRKQNLTKDMVPDLIELQNVIVMG